MAASGFTPISLYYSTTASAVPTAGNLANGELALNTADMKLYAKNSSGVVTLLASNASTTGVSSFSAGTTGFTPNTGTTGAVTLAGTLATTNGGTGLTSFTANRVFYASSTSAIGQSANLTFDGTTLAAAGLSDSGNLTFTGTGNRITGDTVNATVANRLSFVDSGTNNATVIQALPNGTGTVTALQLYTNNTGVNASLLNLVSTSTESQIQSTTTGTGTYLPLTFYTLAAERMRIDTSGNVGIGLTPVASNGILQLNSYGAVQALMEKATISATAATGTVNYDAATQAVLYYTTNASANWTLNIRGSSTLTLNSMMQTGQSLTVAFLVTQGATAYYASALTIDGNAVTPKYQGGTAWSAGNASSIDAYVYTVVKTGSATFTVFASQTQFK